MRSLGALIVVLAVTGCSGGGGGTADPLAGSSGTADPLAGGAGGTADPLTGSAGGAADPLAGNGAGQTSENPAESGESSGGGDDSQLPVPPRVTLAVDRSQVDAGSSVLLSWEASDVSDCVASGGWSGPKAASGSDTVGPVERDTSFTISCSGPGGGVRDSILVRVGDDKTENAKVTISVESEIVQSGDSVVLQWESEHANSCTASGGWSGPQPASGQAVVGPITSDLTFQILCEGGADSAIAAVAVRVGDKTLRWQQPTQNVDGTPIDDLGGYRIYWGTSSRSYIGSHKIDEPSETVWEADIGPGEFYFALTAVDIDGNESDYSNEVFKLIP